MRERWRFGHDDVEPALNGLVENVLSAAREVRQELGAGLLEDIYRVCLVKELRARGHEVRTLVSLPVHYKGERLEKGYQVDVEVDGALLVELKAAAEIHPVHEAQLLTYLRLSGIKVGLLINFNAVPFGTGVVRKVMTRAVA